MILDPESWMDIRRFRARRPTGKGRVERQVAIVREHVLAGRSFDSLAELDAAFDSWLPIRGSVALSDRW